MAEPYDDTGNDGGPNGYDDGGRSRLPRLMTVVVAVAAIGGFSGILVYAYNKGKEVGSTAIPPIIKAGPAPHKIRPENPGGMKIANRDKGVFSRLAASPPPRGATRKVEILLPLPETPVASPAPIKKPATTPKKIELPPPPPVITSIPKPPVDAMPKRFADAAGATGLASDARPSAAKPAKTSVAKKRPSIKTLAMIAPASGGSTRVQLLSLRSEKSVRKAWAGLQKRHADLLGRLALTVQRRNLGSKKGVYYRLQAGPLANVAAARKLCSEFKKRKMGCIIVRR